MLSQGSYLPGQNRPLISRAERTPCLRPKPRFFTQIRATLSGASRSGLCGLTNRKSQPTCNPAGAGPGAWPAPDVDLELMEISGNGNLAIMDYCPISRPCFFNQLSGLQTSSKTPAGLVIRRIRTRNSLSVKKLER